MRLSLAITLALALHRLTFPIPNPTGQPASHLRLKQATDACSISTLLYYLVGTCDPTCRARARPTPGLGLHPSIQNAAFPATDSTCIRGIYCPVDHVHALQARRVRLAAVVSATSSFAPIFLSSYLPRATAWPFGERMSRAYERLPWPGRLALLNGQVATYCLALRHCGVNYWGWTDYCMCRPSDSLSRWSCSVAERVVCEKSCIARPDHRLSIAGVDPARDREARSAYHGPQYQLFQLQQTSRVGTSA